MKRRKFLAGLAASLPVASLRAFQTPPRTSGNLKIAGLEVWRYEGRRERIEGINGQRQTNPLNVYQFSTPPLFRDNPNPTRSMGPISAMFLKIKTDQGLEGIYGPIDEQPAFLLKTQLAGFLAGKDALAVESLWDQMHRSNRHSRRGYFMTALSAVDNALWDLRGRYFQAPVYRLLGGPTRPHVEAYGSCLGFPLESEPIKRRAAALKEEGYRYLKWFPAYGSGHGPEGMNRNVEMVRNLREAVGDDVQLMFDAFSGWDLTYAMEWAKKVEQYRPHWIEEPFSAEKIDSFVQLRKHISFPVASGEHFYGRWEVHDYLKAGALDVVQADPEWCGGVTELVKICTVASAYDVRVIPHGHRIAAAFHVVASQSPMTCPLVEYLINNMPRFQHFEKSPLTPQRGKIALPETPGMGIEIDPAKVEKQSQVTWS